MTPGGSAGTTDPCRQSLAISPMTTTEIEALVEATKAMLLEAACEAGMAPTGDGRLGEANVARLLSMACETLAKRRVGGKAPRHYKLPVGAARISYRLEDVVAWLVMRREDFCDDDD
jgi:hypothetical protein